MALSSKFLELLPPAPLPPAQEQDEFLQHKREHTGQYGEEKTDKDKSTSRNLVVGMPQERPGDKFGTSQGHLGGLGRCMCTFTFKGQNVRGTDGTDDGTDGTCPVGQTGHQTRGCPAKILHVYWFFLSPTNLTWSDLSKNREERTISKETPVNLVRESHEGTEILELLLCSASLSQTKRSFPSLLAGVGLPSSSHLLPETDNTEDEVFLLAPEERHA